MAAPLSRSDLEASLYMQLHPCEYGATGFEPEHTPHVDGDQLRSAGALRLVTVTTAGDGWACQVYGPRGRPGVSWPSLASALVQTRANAHAHWSRNVSDVFRRIQELSTIDGAAGEPGAYLATVFTNPDQLLGGPEEAPAEAE